ncbi:MAG TPA: energy transducer TonB [Pyrinomonadaceae bacterium]|jgi:hypothetical protein|nr:energy transducer TonB [Pyrinomonadaceae bacterium]
MFKVAPLRIFAVTLFVLSVTAFAAAQATGQETEQKPADRPLRVTYNPSGEYTSEARSKMLSGWIKLRITFLDTGELGDIFYVDESASDKALSKAGLLKSSYEAAKKIRFEPAIKDGSPVTVTKILVYNFEIGDRPGFRVGRRP